MARTVHKLLVSTYPRRIRQRFGAEMQLFFADSYSEARADNRPIGKFMLRSYSDLILNSLQARRGNQTNGALFSNSDDVGEHKVKADRGGIVEFFQSGGRELRLAVRGIARAPGFALVVVLTLGLGIGASTAIFSVVDGILLSSLPYPESDNLVVLREQSPPPQVRIGWVSEPTFRDWREQTMSFEDIVAWRLNLAALTGDQSPERVQGYVVSAGFFEVMGIDMTLGRGFLPEEDHPDAEKVVVISRGLWQRRYGADPDILGTNMLLDGVSHAIVGVAGDGHNYPSREADIWSPIALEYEPTFRGFRYLGLIGRVKPGLSLEDAETDLDRVAADIAHQHQETNAGWSAAIEPLKSTIVGRLRPVLVGMMVAVLLLLLIAVGNVTNLFVARLMDRQQELAIRRSLGASRSSLARLFVTEATVVTTVGCFLGICAAISGTRVLGVLARGRLPRLDQVAVDARVLAFAVVLALAIALLLGLFPVAVSSTKNGGVSLRAGTRSSTGHRRANRVRELILTVQVALAITLLVGASLLGRSLWNLQQIDPGFDPDQVVSFELNLPASRYDPEQLQAVFPELLDRMSGIPGVAASGYVHPMPMVLGSVPSQYAIQSRAVGPEGDVPMAHPRMASPGYFAAMDIPLVRGRYLEATDGPNDLPVAVVNQAFVDRYLSEGDPIGERVTWSDPNDPDAVWFAIVGVVGNVLFRRLTDPPEPEVYTAVAQTPNGFGQLVLRYPGSPDQLRASMQEVFRAIDPDLPVTAPLRAKTTIDEGLGPARLNTTLIAFFASTAGALALVGVLGVLTIVVNRRMREIGIRMVLGAQPGLILRFVLAKGLRPVLIGIVAGTAASAFLTRFLASQVYGTSTLDPVAFLLPSLAFVITATIACQWPAKRAARLDPASVIRIE